MKKTKVATVCEVRKGKKVACYTAIGETSGGARRTAKAGLAKLVRRIERIEQEVRKVKASGGSGRWYSK